MLHEKKPCIVCARDTTADLRDCTGCRESLCRHCIREHVCGEDGRPELVQLLGEHVTECEGAGGLIMAEVCGAIVAYLPRLKVISIGGIEILIARSWQGAEPVYTGAKKIAEALCGAPLNARGAVCLAASEGFCSMFAAKKADTPEVLAQFRAMLEARRLISF